MEKGIITMKLFNEINANIAQHQDRLVTENLSDLSAAEIGKIVRYVIQQQKDGSKDGAGELAGQALENIPGMEGASEKELSSVISTVERAVKMQSDGAAYQAKKAGK